MLDFTLKNIPPKYNSCLGNIHLLATFSCIDLKKYGFASILAPIMEDIKRLEDDDGVLLSTADGCFSTRGSIIQVARDKLGQHAISGLVESFSANKPCRFCNISKGEIQEILLEEQLDMRTKQNFTQQLQSVVNDHRAVSACGIEHDSLLNRSRYFHVTSNFCPEIMHDILEGVAPYEVKLLLQKFITEHRLFTIDFFNRRLSNLTIDLYIGVINHLKFL